MTEHCTGQYSFGQATPQPNHGTCLYVDGDGDKVMIDWTYVMPAGTKQIVAGTGKYAGITGKGTFVNTQLKPPGEGMDAWLADIDLDFQIKSPSQ
jgi:hypothetical protein